MSTTDAAGMEEEAIGSYESASVQLPMMIWMQEFLPVSGVSTSVLEENVERAVRMIGDGEGLELDNEEDLFLVSTAILLAEELLDRGHTPLFLRARLVSLYSALHAFGSTPGFETWSENQSELQPSDTWLAKVAKSSPGVAGAAYGDFVENRDRVLAAVPIHPTTLRTAGRMALRRHEWAESEVWLRRYLEREPTDGSAYVELFEALLSQDDAGAEEIAKKVVALFPWSGTTLKRVRGRVKMRRVLAPLRAALEDPERELDEALNALRTMSTPEALRAGSAGLEQLLQARPENRELYTFSAGWLAWSLDFALWTVFRSDPRWSGLPSTERSLLDYLFAVESGVAKTSDLPSPEEVCGSEGALARASDEICEVLHLWTQTPSSEDSLDEAWNALAGRTRSPSLLLRAAALRLMATGDGARSFELAKRGLSFTVGTARNREVLFVASLALAHGAWSGEAFPLEWASDQLEEIARIGVPEKGCPDGGCYSRAELRRLQIQIRWVQTVGAFKEGALNDLVGDTDALLAQQGDLAIEDPVARAGLHLLGIHGAWLEQDVSAFRTRSLRVRSTFPGTAMVDYICGVQALLDEDIGEARHLFQRAYRRSDRWGYFNWFPGARHWGVERFRGNTLKMLARAASEDKNEESLLFALRSLGSGWERAFPSETSSRLDELVVFLQLDAPLRRRLDGTWIFSPSLRVVLAPFPGQPELNREVVGKLLRRLDPGAVMPLE